MMMKKISKVIVYYDDGTFQEITHSVHPTQDKENKESPKTSPVVPDWRPDYQQIREWNPSVPYQPTYVVPNTDPSLPPWTVTCGTGNVDLKYTVTSPDNYKFTSTGNFSNDNKYSITSTGNGINVDFSK